MERARHIELWGTHGRWLAIGAAAVLLAKQVNVWALVGFLCFAAAYNLFAVFVCSNPRWFRRMRLVIAFLIRAADMALITAAIIQMPKGLQPLPVLYLVPIVTAVIGYSVKAGLTVTTLCAILLLMSAWLSPVIKENVLRMPGLGELLTFTHVGWITLLYFCAFGSALVTPVYYRLRRTGELLRQLEALYDLSRESPQLENLDVTLQMILDLAIAQTDAREGRLYLLDGDETLQLKAATPWPEFLPNEGKLKLGEGIPGYVFQTGRPLLHGELDEPTTTHFFRQVEEVMPLQGTTTSMSVPIKVRGKVIGVMSLTSGAERGSFTEDDLRLLLLFATHVATAIENARLLAELREQTRIDELTGLYNRRHFDKVLPVECSRSIRYNYPLSLLMIDIDHFKNCNDTFGHVVGDEVLRKVAELIRKGMREADIVVRYGGEEFAVLLPHTPLQGALAAGERLRKSISSLELELGEPPQRYQITVSVGASAFRPDLMKEPWDLVRAADSALYRAKEQGRNRVVSVELPPPQPEPAFQPTP